MYKQVFLSCGCASNGLMYQKAGITYNPPIPCCTIHMCCEQVPGPDLTGRTAKCAYVDCDNDKPSSLDLPFFKYKGDTSAPGQVLLKGLRSVLLREYWHLGGSGEPKKDSTEKIKELYAQLQQYNHDITEAAEFDSYYCGCKGFD